MTEHIPTSPHEGALAMVHYLFINEGVVHHLVVFHAAEAAVFHTVVHLILHQGALEERAYLFNGTMKILWEERDNNNKIIGEKKNRNY